MSKQQKKHCIKLFQIQSTNNSLHQLIQTVLHLSPNSYFHVIIPNSNPKFEVFTCSKISNVIGCFKVSQNIECNIFFSKCSNISSVLVFLKCFQLIECNHVVFVLHQNLTLEPYTRTLRQHLALEPYTRTLKPYTRILHQTLTHSTCIIHYTHQVAF